MALKRSRLTLVSHIICNLVTQLRIFLQAARDKAVKNAIESGERTADDKENIEKLHSSIEMVPVSDIHVISDEDKE